MEAGNKHKPTQISVSLRAQSGSLFLVIVTVLLVDLLSKGCTTILLKCTKSELKLKQDSQDYISDTGFSLITTQIPGYGYDPHQSQTAFSLLQLRYQYHTSGTG